MSEKNVPDLEGYVECEKAWLSTLEKFGIERPILMFEKVKIMTLIRQYDWKSTMYALTGARFEAKTQSFDPAKYVSLTRVFHNFELFINLASQAMTKQKKAKNEPK